MSFSSLPLVLKVPDLLLHVAAGIGIGWLYFVGVSQSAHLMLDRPMAAITWTALRFGLLGLALTVIAFEGALPLLLTVLGLIAARHAVLKRRMA